MAFNYSQSSYIRLRDHYAERRRPIVFWIGAGLSTDAGLPTWIGLRGQIISQAMENITSIETAEAAEIEQQLEIAKANENLWEAFHSIKKAIGETEFRETIKHIFKASSEQQVPDIYSILWGLKNIDGIIPLNIDSFASRSHRAVRTNEDILIFNGRDAKDYISALSNGRPFIANLHGQKDAYSSWIFTKSDIDRLTSDESYKDFINFVFTSMTVVFLGISADDMAAGGFLEKLTTKGLDVGPHFWITSRVDRGLNSWSSKAGVQIIRYKPEMDVGGKQNHSVVLAEIFSQLHQHVSKDVKPDPIVPRTDAVDAIPTVKDLFQIDQDESRGILSGYAKKLLEQNDYDTSNEDYKNFLDNYSPAIYQTWHITEKPPYNIFLAIRSRIEYRILHSLMSGGFQTKISIFMPLK